MFRLNVLIINKSKDTHHTYHTYQLLIDLSASLEILDNINDISARKKNDIDILVFLLLQAFSTAKDFLNLINK